MTAFFVLKICFAFLITNFVNIVNNLFLVILDYSVVVIVKHAV